MQVGINANINSQKETAKKCTEHGGGGGQVTGHRAEDHIRETVKKKKMITRIYLGETLRRFSAGWSESGIFRWDANPRYVHSSLCTGGGWGGMMEYVSCC